MIDELREGATQASQELAHERGAFPLFDDSDLDTPRRNVALLNRGPDRDDEYADGRLLRVLNRSLRRLSTVKSAIRM